LTACVLMAEVNRNWLVFTCDSANTCRFPNLQAGGKRATVTAKSMY